MLLSLFYVVIPDIGLMAGDYLTDSINKVREMIRDPLVFVMDQLGMNIVVHMVVESDQITSCQVVSNG